MRPRKRKVEWETKKGEEKDRKRERNKGFWKIF